MTLTPIDDEALTRAVQTVRKNPEMRQKLDEWIAKGRDPEIIRRSCAGLCQIHTLKLQELWMLPPCSPTIANNLSEVLLEPYNTPSRTREIGEVLKKLLSLNLSRYEPDPPRAIGAAEQQRRAST